MNSIQLLALTQRLSDGQLQQSARAGSMPEIYAMAELMRRKNMRDTPQVKPPLDQEILGGEGYAAGGDIYEGTERLYDTRRNNRPLGGELDYFRDLFGLREPTAPAPAADAPVWDGGDQAGNGSRDPTVMGPRGAPGTGNPISDIPNALGAMANVTGLDTPGGIAGAATGVLTMGPVGALVQAIVDRAGGTLIDQARNAAGYGPVTKDTPGISTALGRAAQQAARDLAEETGVSPPGSAGRGVNDPNKTPDAAGPKPGWTAPPPSADRGFPEAEMMQTSSRNNGNGLVSALDEDAQMASYAGMGISFAEQVERERQAEIARQEAARKAAEEAAARQADPGFTQAQMDEAISAVNSLPGVNPGDYQNAAARVEAGTASPFDMALAGRVNWHRANGGWDGDQGAAPADPGFAADPGFPAAPSTQHFPAVIGYRNVLVSTGDGSYMERQPYVMREAGEYPVGPSGEAIYGDGAGEGGSGSGAGGTGADPGEKGGDDPNGPTDSADKDGSFGAPSDKDGQGPGEDKGDGDNGSASGDHGESDAGSSDGGGKGGDDGGNGGDKAARGGAVIGIRRYADGGYVNDAVPVDDENDAAPLTDEEMMWLEQLRQQDELGRRGPSVPGEEYLTQTSAPGLLRRGANAVFGSTLGRRGAVAGAAGGAYAMWPSSGQRMATPPNPNAPTEAAPAARPNPSGGSGGGGGGSGGLPTPPAQQAPPADPEARRRSRIQEERDRMMAEEGRRRGGLSAADLAMIQLGLGMMGSSRKQPLAALSDAATPAIRTYTDMARNERQDRDSHDRRLSELAYREEMLDQRAEDRRSREGIAGMTDQRARDLALARAGGRGRGAAGAGRDEAAYRRAIQWAGTPSDPAQREQRMREVARMFPARTGGETPAPTEGNDPLRMR